MAWLCGGMLHSRTKKNDLQQQGRILGAKCKGKSSQKVIEVHMPCGYVSKDTNKCKTIKKSAGIISTKPRNGYFEGGRRWAGKSQCDSMGTSNQCSVLVL